MDRVASTYQSQLGHDLHIIEVPTEADEAHSYPRTVETEIEESLLESLV
jgi:hypothetical protein